MHAEGRFRNSANILRRIFSVPGKAIIMTRTGRASILLVAIVALCAGCDTKPKSNYKSLNLVNASGKITLDGAPLEGAVVSFDDPTDDTFSYGMTDSSGQFSLQIDSEMKGVKPGAKIVRISTTRKILGLNVKEEGGDPSEKPAQQPERVPDKYYKKSKLFVEVTPDKSRYDFELKSN